MSEHGEHGISIRNRETKELIEFVKCGLGREALIVLSGVRRNLGRDYVATEEFVDTTEIEGMKK